MSTMPLRYGVVMIHGTNQTETNFERTPDGRDGWAQYFVRAGYKVFLGSRLASFGTHRFQ
jgi:hypothetical protein